MSGRWRNAELAWQPLYGVQIEETTGQCRSLNPARHGLTVSGTGCFENPDCQKKLSNSALDFSAESDGPKARAEPSQTPTRAFGAQPRFSHPGSSRTSRLDRSRKASLKPSLDSYLMIEEELLNLRLTMMLPAVAAWKIYAGPVGLYGQAAQKTCRLRAPPALWS